MKKTSLLAAGLLGLALPVQAVTPAFTPANVVKAIVGEAAGDGYAVQVAVACAIRNRGSLKGVYGVNAKHNATEPAWVWRQADRAWTESGQHDVTRGATHFGNADDVHKGTFRGLKLTVVVGEGTHKTYFFKA